MRRELALGAALALCCAAHVKAAPPVELAGCSEGFDTPLLERALSLEMNGELPGDYRLSAHFGCDTGEPTAGPSTVELVALEASGRELRATLELAGVPDHAQPRLLALVWRELLAALAGEPARSAAQESAPVVLPASSSFAPASSQPAPVRPLARATASPVAAPARDARLRRARRTGLLSRATDGGELFDASLAFSAVTYLSGWDPLFGGSLGVRLDALRALAFYRQHPTESTGLGEVQARVYGLGLELAVWCEALRKLQSCALGTVEVGRGQVSGHAFSGRSAAQALDVLFLSSALGLSSRLSSDWLALELGLHAGYARGPTATVDGYSQVTLHGGFVSLSLGAVMQP